MKRKLLLLLCSVLTSVSMWAWTSVVPYNGRSYYLYNIGENKYWYGTSGEYGTTDNIADATPVNVEYVSADNFKLAFEYGGTTYKIYQNDGERRCDNTTGVAFWLSGSTGGYELRSHNGGNSDRVMNSGGWFPKTSDSKKGNITWQFISVYEVNSGTAAECASTTEASYLSAANGWERVTDNATLDASLSDYFFAIVCANYPGLMVNMATSNASQQGSEGFAGTKSMWYSTAVDPTTNNSFLWAIEKNNTAGYVGYTFRNISYPSLTIQAESGRSYFAHTRDQSNACQWNSYELAQTAGVYTIKTLANGGDNYLGLWTRSNDYINGQELAGNKGTSEQGKFLIYRLPKQRLRNVSFTANITNPSFETGDDTGWTHASSQDTGVKSSSGKYATTGTDGTYLFNTWWQGVPLSQTIENIPNGKYRMTVSLAGSDDGQDGKYFLLAEGSHSNVITITKGTKGTFNNYSYDFVVSDKSATIGVVGGNDDGTYNENGHWWYKADNFRLTYIGQQLSEGADAFTNPSSVTNDAWYKYTEVSAGWYVITSSAATTLSYTQDGTKSVGDNDFSTLTLAAGVSQCLLLTSNPLYFKSSNAATLTITALTSGMDITSCITNPSFETGNMTGWTTGDMWEQGNKSFDRVVGDYYAECWHPGTAGTKSLSQEIANLPYGYYELTANAYANNDVSSASLFITTGETTTNSNNISTSNVYSVKVLYDGSSAFTIGFTSVMSQSVGWECVDDFRLTYLGDATANLTVSDGKLGTFIAPFDITLPENVKAYSADSYGETVTLAKIAEGGVEGKDVLEAGTPVIVYGDGVDVNTNFYGKSKVTENQTAGVLVGILDNSSKTIASGNYVLQTIDDKQAFYKLNVNAIGKLNRCYLTSGVGSSRLAILMDDDDPTAINAIETAEETEGLKDGKYLENGQIIIVKNGVKYSANGQILK